jgi:hypothetical protein
MARHSNGHAPPEVRYPIDQAPLSALQELIGEIGNIGTTVARFGLGDYEVYLFAIRRERNSPTAQLRRGVRRPAAAPNSPDTADTPNNSAVQLEDIIDAACRRMKVSRADVASRKRSRPIALARVLIAHYASRAGASTVTQIAAKFNLNPNSFYVSMARFKKVVPGLFQMPMKQFVNAIDPPSKKLLALMGEKWSAMSAPLTAADSEIGNRLAKALPSATSP